MENLYIREFVEHYKGLGFYKIYLYDNNNIRGERFTDVIGDYIDSGFVELNDWRGKEYCQTLSYQDCYERYSQECDWILFVDCDEFLTILDGNRTVGEFLSQGKFQDYSIVLFNWMCYGDSDLMRYDSRNVQERFTKPIEPVNSFETNRHIKSIIRTRKDITWIGGNPHIPFIKDHNVLVCDAEGRKCDASPFQKINHNVAYLKHYTTKTLEEWVSIKVLRGYADANKDFYMIHDILQTFYAWGNEQTIEKNTFYKELVKVYKIRQKKIFFKINSLRKRLFEK
jgi:hypothetical protein